MMPAAFNVHPAWLAFCSAGIGLLIGWAHLRCLRWSVMLLVSGRSPRVAQLLQVLRLPVIGAALFLCARFGVSLPALLAGLLLVRTAALLKEKT